MGELCYDSGQSLWGKEGQRLMDLGEEVCCCCSVTQSCLTLCDPMNCSMPGFLSFTISLSLLKLMSIQ